MVASQMANEQGGNHAESRWLFQEYPRPRCDNVVAGIFRRAVAVSLLAHFQSASVDLWAWLDGFMQSFGTEMFGAFVTFLLIETLVGGRRSRETGKRETQREKARVIREMRSKDNGIALRAVDELRAHGWLHDGSLREAFLDYANLEGAYLVGADLHKARLLEANLVRADMHRGDLQSATLVRAELQSADTRWADLQKGRLVEANLKAADLRWANMDGISLVEADLDGADLGEASLRNAWMHRASLQNSTLNKVVLHETRLDRTDLRGALLIDADLQGANLSGALLVGANMQGARLENDTLGSVIFDENTVLPDNSKWTQETDMGRFTGAEHPEFWRSDDPSSPAFGG